MRLIPSAPQTLAQDTPSGPADDAEQIAAQAWAAISTEAEPNEAPNPALHEAAIWRSKSLLQHFIDELPGTVFVKGQDGRLLMVNRPLADRLGRTPQSLVGLTVQDIFPPDVAQTLGDLDRDMFASGGRRMVQEQFGHQHFETHLFVIARNGSAPLLAGLSLDATERFEAMQLNSVLLQINDMGAVLSESELLGRTLEMAQALTGSAIGFLHFVCEDQQNIELVTWTAGALRDCSAAADRHYPLEQAGLWADCVRSGRAVVVNDYAHAPDKRGLPAGHTALRRLVTVPIIEAGQVRLIMGVGNRDSDYSEHHVEALALIGGEVWRIVRRLRAEAALSQRVAELSQANQELAQAQAQLLQAEKMAAIGQLAAGVAHEINNPVGYVKSNLGTLADYADHLLELLQAYAALEPALQAAQAPGLAALRARKAALDLDFVREDLPALLSESRKGLERVAQIVQDLKSFSRSGDVRWDWSDLLAGLESTLNVVWNQIKYKADVERALTPLPAVYCIAPQINQVLMNLLVNAAQAIPEGAQPRGRITLRSGRQDQQVWIEVQDNGCGIAAAQLGRVFEPFFTTKPPGEGTGLGLSIATGIAQRHGGQLTVQSAPGQGTCFRLSLPIEGPTPGRDPAQQDGA